MAQNIQFVDVTGESGLAFPLAPSSPGMAVGDYDGDGWLDVCISGALDPRPRIFRSNGARVLAGETVRWFEDVTPLVMDPGSRPASVSIFADIDNDGDQDLVSTRRFASLTVPMGNPHDTGLYYYENTGPGFRRGRSPNHLARNDTRHGGLALADLDMDGDLDIVFTHNGNPNQTPIGGPPVTIGAPGFAIRNDGIPHLVDATATLAPSLADPRRYFSVVLADFNADGTPDLHAAVDSQQDFHCHNFGGSLVDVSSTVGTYSIKADMGLAVGDMDNDGDFDVYSTAINEGTLYVNDGAGTFSDGSFAAGVASWGSAGGQTRVGWGSTFSDFDMDGDLDLMFVAQFTAGLLFLNDGNGVFHEATAGSGLDLLGHGLIPFDFDHDGDLDVLVMPTGYGNFPRLYENVTPVPNCHWLIVDLEGTTSNRDGVGAKVEVQIGPRTLTRPILAGSSFKSGPPMNAHFGVGGATTIDELRVTWPTGIVQTLTDVPVDQRLTIVEP
jgi:hypothetical protein